MTRAQHTIMTNIHAILAGLTLVTGQMNSIIVEQPVEQPREAPSMRMRILEKGNSASLKNEDPDQ